MTNRVVADERHMKNGFRVVLTAERTLMARFGVLFDGMVSSSQTTRTPPFLMKSFVAPGVPSDSLRAARGPLGLRRIEAALVESGGDPSSLAIVTAENLPRAVGPATRIIGVSSGDPAGFGMNSSTMEAVTGGGIYCAKWFRDLLERIRELRQQAPDATVVVGGPGAWQLASQRAAENLPGIDHVILGYCEWNVADIFARIAAGERLPRFIRGEGPSADRIPRVRGATIMGIVEISRGCGLGCGFCTLAAEPMIHLPPETILADVMTNVESGQRNISLISEDIFRYAAVGTNVAPDKLCGLLERIRSVPGLGLLQIDHANISSAAGYSDEQLKRVRRLLAGGENPRDFVWLNLGVETASGELLRANGGRAKMNGSSPDDWGDLCMEQVHRLVNAGFFPLISLVFGLPGERPEHVRETDRWVEKLSGERVAVFPLFYAPVAGSDKPFGLPDMTPAHWRLLKRCYRLNFKWIPRLCWDNQTRGSVALWRRLLGQAFGRAQTIWWKGLFAWKSRRRFA